MRTPLKKTADSAENSRIQNNNQNTKTTHVALGNKRPHREVIEDFEAVY